MKNRVLTWKGSMGYEVKKSKIKNVDLGMIVINKLSNEKRQYFSCYQHHGQILSLPGTLKVYSGLSPYSYRPCRANIRKAAPKETAFH